MWSSAVVAQLLKVSGVFCLEMPFHTPQLQKVAIRFAAAFLQYSISSNLPAYFHLTSLINKVFQATEL